MILTNVIGRKQTIDLSPQNFSDTQLNYKPSKIITESIYTRVKNTNPPAHIELEIDDSRGSIN